MRQWLQRVKTHLKSDSASVRWFIGLYMLVQGITRIITGGSAAHINIFSARMIGVAMALAGILLLVTLATRWRCTWIGRAMAIYATAIWLLLIASAWSAAAWISISGGFVFILALVNEVRIYDC